MKLVSKHLTDVFVGKYASSGFLMFQKSVVLSISTDLLINTAVKITEVSNQAQVSPSGELESDYVTTTPTAH